MSGYDEHLMLVYCFFLDVGAIIATYRHRSVMSMSAMYMTYGSPCLFNECGSTASMQRIAGMTKYGAYSALHDRPAYSFDVLSRTLSQKLILVHK